MLLIMCQSVVKTLGGPQITKKMFLEIVKKHSNIHLITVLTAEFDTKFCKVVVHLGTFSY